VFQRGQGGADNWGEVKKLVASDAHPDDYFGKGVAISGDTAIVGTEFGDAAYIFQRDQGGPNNWGEVKKLSTSQFGYDDGFGESVAISGVTVIVGASSDRTSGMSAGAAYVFDRDRGGSGSWGLVKKLTAWDAEAGIGFGFGVAVTADTAIVGARTGNNGGMYTGSAYVFERDQGSADNWGEVSKLTASDAGERDNFGASVAASGKTVIIGAATKSVEATSDGAAYVFVPPPVGGEVELISSPPGAHQVQTSPIAWSVTWMVPGAAIAVSVLGLLVGTWYHRVRRARGR
jgi:hypothetical protein